MLIVSFGFYGYIFYSNNNIPIFFGSNPFLNIMLVELCTVDSHLYTYIGTKAKVVLNLISYYRLIDDNA